MALRRSQHLIFYVSPPLAVQGLPGLLYKRLYSSSQVDSSAQVCVTEADEVVRPKAADSFGSPTIFHDQLVNKFVNCMMWDGKKNIARNIMKESFEQIKLKQIQAKRAATDNSELIEVDPLKIFYEAVENCKPVLGCQTMKKQGKNFQVPYPLPQNRRRFLAMKWLITAARNQPGNNVAMSVKLCKEFLDAYKNQGAVVRKKQDFHKTAESNRAYAHYRWW